MESITENILRMNLVNVFDQFERQSVVLAPRIMAGLSFFIGIMVAVQIGDYFIRRIIARFDHRRAHVFNMLRQTCKAALLIIAVITALGTFGVNVSALIASLGLTGFALGFAMRDALSNLLAGVMILLYRPFGLGDRISVMGFEGNVTNIDLRYTTLTIDEKTFLIPNSILFTNAITVVKPADLKS